MRTFSTVAIFALALTGANAAVYTGDGAVTQSGVVTVGDPAACPVRLPAQSSLFCVGRFASVSVTTRAPARGARTPAFGARGGVEADASFMRVNMGPHQAKRDPARGGASPKKGALKPIPVSKGAHRSSRSFQSDYKARLERVPARRRGKCRPAKFVLRSLADSLKTGSSPLTPLHGGGGANPG